VNGIALPGTLMAIMGASGAGYIDKHFRKIFFFNEINFIK